MSDNLEQKIIEKIKHESLAPTPRWHFLLKEWLVWLVGVLSLLVGAAAVSVMIYLSKNNDLFIYDQVGRSFSGWLLLSLPYFWIVFLTLFVWILFYNIKHTKRGYRYPLFLIALFSVFASVLLGGAFSLFGLGEKIDDVLGRQAPFYDIIFNPHVDIWSRPEEGRLSGLVISNSSENTFVLVDREREEWQVAYSGKEGSGGNNAVIVGQPVRAIGKVTGEGLFSAQKIMAMQPGREFFRRLKPEGAPPLNFGPGKDAPACLADRGKLLDWLRQYPELKQALEQGLLDNQDLIREISADNPDFLPMLQSLNVSPETIQIIFSR
ncbi:MAG: hypothetical protein PHG95_00345 [Patescibacteria group bacterium]|nr:hypothetical protein [Patescibacteria group bacterium]